MRPIVFIHGWGLAPSLWSAVIAELDGADCHLVNMGFRGVPQTPMPAAPIVVGHSMGFAWALENIPRPWSQAVAINGFARFSRAPDFPAGIDRRILARMQARLADDPGAVTGDFLTRAGLDRPVVNDLDNAALARHLAWLADMDMRGPLATLDCPILALCGENDAIVPAPLSAASFPADRIEWITSGDHMAPIKNADLIASRLRSLRMGRSS